MSFLNRESKNRSERSLSKTAVRAAAMTLAAAMIFTGAGCSKPKDPGGRGIKLDDYITLGQYTGLEVEKVSGEYTDEEFRDEVHRILDMYSNYGYFPESVYTKYNKVDKPLVEEGDTVNIDYAGYKDDVAFDGGTAEGQYLTIGSHRFISGFEEGLIGAAVGEERDLNLKFPDDYQSASNLAGAEVVFKVKVNGIYEKEFDLTDEVTQLVFSSTVDELREKVTEAKKEDAKNEMRSSVMKEIVKKSTISGYPEEVWQDYYDYNYKGAESSAAQAGLELADYLKQARNTTVEEFEANCKDYANHQTDYYLVLMAVCEKENITLTNEEYESYVSKRVEDSSISREEYFNSVSEQDIREDILCEKAITWIMDHSVLVEKSE